LISFFGNFQPSSILPEAFSLLSNEITYVLSGFSWRV